MNNRTTGAQSDLRASRPDGDALDLPTRDSFKGDTPWPHAISRPACATWLIGAQYLLLPPPAPSIKAATGAAPRKAAMARGVVSINAAPGSQWMMLATVRQVFSTYTSTGDLVEFDSAAYPVPLLGGPEQTF